MADQHHTDGRREPSAAFWNRSGRELQRIAAGSPTCTRSIERQRTLIAMLDLPSADALITTWPDKHYYNFWRPRAAIDRRTPMAIPTQLQPPGADVHPTLQRSAGGPPCPPPYPARRSPPAMRVPASPAAFF